MAKLDICTCLIQLNEYTTIARTETSPLNYAEVDLLRFQLGERSISDLVVIRTEDSNNQEVLDRLRENYGPDKVAEAFPGIRPRLPLEAPADTPRAGAEPAEPPKHLGRKRGKAAEDTDHFEAAEPQSGD